MAATNTRGVISAKSSHLWLQNRLLAPRPGAKDGTKDAVCPTLSASLLTTLASAHEQDALGGTRKVDSLGPGEMRQKRLGRGNLRRTNKESEATGGGGQAGGDREYGLEALDGAQGDQLGAVGDAFILLMG